MRSSAQREETARPEARHGADTSGSASRRHRGRVWLGRVLVLVAVLGAFALLLLIQVEAVRDDLERARSQMERGRDLLLAGDATRAAESFEGGGDSFAAAAAGSRSWILGGVAWIPVAGRTVDVLTAIADAGETTAEGAALLSGAVADIPGGLAGLAPTRGALPLDEIPPLAEAAGAAEHLMADALSRIEQAPDSLLIGPV